MKLLIENWKRYLKEQEEGEEYNYDAEVAKEKEELEKKHFGASANIGEMIYKVYQEEMITLEAQGYSPDDIIDQHNDIFDVVKTKFNKLGSSNKIASTDLENSGRGSFRAVFSCDKDYVIKIDASIDGSGKDMNREDQQLGTNKKYGDIFPRVFMFDPEYKWIVAEKVKEVTTPEEINKFFPNPVFRSNLMNTNMYLTGIKRAMEYKVAQMQGDKQAIQDIEDMFASLKRTGLTYNSYATVEKVIQNFSKNPNFFKIVSAVFEHGIDIDDSLRPWNTGIGSDGRLVILDSSIADTLNKGRAAF